MSQTTNSPTYIWAADLGSGASWSTVTFTNGVDIDTPSYKIIDTYSFTEASWVKEEEELPVIVFEIKPKP